MKGWCGTAGPVMPAMCEVAPGRGVSVTAAVRATCCDLVACQAAVACVIRACVVIV